MSSIKVPRIQVVIGLAIRKFSDGKPRVLLQKRPENTLRPGMWELAGGKVEPGESRRQALRREWKEELDVDVEVSDHSVGYCLIPLKQTLEISLYRVEIADGQECRQELYNRDMLAWFDFDFAVERLPCVPSTYLLYWRIKREIDNV